MPSPAQPKNLCPAPTSVFDEPQQQTPCPRPPLAPASLSFQASLNRHNNGRSTDTRLSVVLDGAHKRRRWRDVSFSLRDSVRLAQSRPPATCRSMIYSGTHPGRNRRPCGLSLPKSAQDDSVKTAPASILFV